MKNLKIISAVFGMFFLVVGSSFAGTATVESEKAPQVGIVANASLDRVVVAFNNDADNPYWVAIEDSKGNTLHTETISENGVYNKRFDLGELEDGEYAVKVGRGDEIASVETIYRK